jgi:hypothetical protein
MFMLCLFVFFVIIVLYYLFYIFMIDSTDTFTGDLFMLGNTIFTPEDLVVVGQGLICLSDSITRQRNKYAVGSDLHTAFDKRLQAINQVRLKIGGK